jgi:3-hydroxyisobutyrate dehydrogenase-like beta-hydroxyacid dehydrogenase
MKERIGVLHPGQMGISIAAAAQNSDYPVYWASAGRSSQTAARADQHHLQDVGSLANLCQRCDILISVCPPAAAETVADEVAALSFPGLFVDANAISPTRTVRIAQTIQKGGGRYVDGGIIGGPAWEPGRTWLYLSGPEAQRAADVFAAGPLETSILGPEIGHASALKICFAAYTKGTTALLCAILATAETLGVRPALERQWSRDGSDFADQTQQRVRRVTAKAWRFHGEMDEIAATFQAAGLPGDFHAAASAIYRRLAHFKDAANLPDLETVLAALVSAETVSAKD